LVRAQLLFVIALALAPAAPTRAEDDVVARARAASAAGRRADEIALLEAHLAGASHDVDARLAVGLLLSWEGRFDDARRELGRVLEQAPDYLDARVALMNVESWAGDVDAARAQARLVLAQQPHHPEARLVAERARANEAPFTLSFSHTHDWFDDERAPWGESALSLGRETTIGTVLGRISHVRRFGLTDQLLELEAYPRFRPGTYASLGLAAATSADLYPEWRLAAELHQSLPGAFEVSAGYRRLAFAEPVDIALAALTKYVASWMLTARIYYVPAAAGGGATSTFLGVRRYYGDEGTSYVGLRYGHGLAREELRDSGDLVNVGSDSLAIELDTALPRRVRLLLRVGASCSERARGADLWQITLSTGLKVGF
jgi:YaiO family outer membrane protein